MAELVERISARLHEGTFDKRGLIGKPGYAVPNLQNPVVATFEDIAAGKISKVRIASGPASSDNLFVVEDGATLTAELRIHATEMTHGAVVIVGKDLTLHGDVRLFASNQTVILSGGRPEVGHYGKFDALLWGDEQILFVGAGCSTNGNTYVASVPGSEIIIGDDCMFAETVHLSTSDQHAILDMETGEQLNSPGDIILEPHVWLSRLVTVAKGVVIGMGSVVGAHSFVNRAIPRFSVAGGVPAKIIRHNTTWDRVLNSRPYTVKKLQDLAIDVPVASI